MNIDLQDFVPFSDHFSWTLSQTAYQHLGIKNWLSGHVPTYMTGNAALAKQKAEMLLHHLNQKTEQTKPSSPETITVLELGGGNGLFAWHFIQSFESQAANKDYHLRYILTDAHTSGLEYLTSLIAFQDMLQRGVLVLQQADFFKPKQRYLIEKEESKPFQIDLLLCNYLFCNLPFRVLRWHNEHCEELYISSTLRLKQEILPTQLQDQIKHALQQQLGKANAWPIGCAELTLKPLKQELSSAYPKICDALNTMSKNLWPMMSTQTAIQRIDVPGNNRIEKDWWKQQLQAKGSEWQACHINALNCLKVWAQWLKEDGLLFISDKGITQTERVYPGPPKPYGHGFHSSWPVNFPLLHQFLKYADFQSQHTTNPLWTFHSLLASKTKERCAQKYSIHSLFQKFDQTFEENNSNQYAADLIDSAEDYYLQEQWRKAAILFQQALIYRPGDARVIYQMVACLIELQAFNQAGKVLQEEIKDLFAQYDFAFQRGQVKLFQGAYQQASQAFKESLTDYGPDTNTFYNLGLTKIFLNQYEDARYHFRAALELDPDFEIARTALETWK